MGATSRPQSAISLPGCEVFIEIVLRIAIIGIALLFELVPAFERKIQPEETWLYKNPRTSSYVPVPLLYVLIFVVPSSVIVVVNYLQPKNRSDISAAHLGITLAIGVAALITNILKVCIGRCFPSGEGDFSKPCTGSPAVISEGRKSFPSGHSSLAFAAYTFLTLYLLTKLQTLNSTIHRFRTTRLLLAGSPLFAATLIAVSRTCDYHHHWQDVTVGSILGLLAGYLSYRQQYPSVFDQDAALPLAEYPVYGPEFVLENNFLECQSSPIGPLPFHKQNAKWI